LPEEEHPVVLEGKRPDVLEEKRRAVIIGINEYEDKGIQPLKGAENDAKEIYERLKDPNIGGFEIPKSHFLLGEEATYKATRKAISDLFWKTNPSDLALFYFSGHGFVDSYEDGYIAPYDMSKDEPFVCGINMEQIKQVISRSHKYNKCVIMILDCCFSGIATKGDFKKKFDERIKDLSGEGTIVLSSSEADNVSREISFTHQNGQEHNHGAFTACLIEGLDGQASDDESGIITLDKLHKHVEKRIAEMEGKQKPNLYVAEGFGISSIRMAVAPQKYYANIQMKIEEAERYFLTGIPLDLMDAANRISEVMKISTKNEKALDLKKKIRETLIEYKSDVTNWLIENEAEEDCRPIRSVFPELQILTNNLDFDKIIAISDTRKKAFLGNLCRVSKTLLDKNIFIDLCKKYYSSPSTQRPTAGGPTVGHLNN